MMKTILLFSLLFVISCAFNNRSRKNVATSEVVIRGGVYENKSWDDALKFKRTSWYDEASMQYDILISELNEDSKFANWLGRDKGYLKDCEKFFIAALYSDLITGEGVSYLSSQLEKKGLEKKSVVDFSENFKAHHNFSDWKLYDYKIYGFCENKDKSIASNEKIIVSIPGFKTQSL